MRRMKEWEWDAIDFMLFVYFRVFCPLFFLFALIAFPLLMADGISLLFNGQGIIEQIHSAEGSL